MKKNAMAKVFASIALFGILIGIVGTAILFIVQGGAQQYAQPETLTEEEIQKLIEESGLNIDQSELGDINENGSIDGGVSDEDLQFITGDDIPEGAPEAEGEEATSQE